MATPKLLIYDIEISPIYGTAWQTYDTSLVWVEREWYLLCFAWKWYGQKKTNVISLPDFPLYEHDPNNDLEVARKLFELFNEADIVLAHNGDKFDYRKAYSRFIYHNLGVPSPCIQIDTLKMARKHFGFTSNRLNDLGEFLGVGSKIKTDKDLWRDVIAGDLSAWRRMKTYNRHDVDLLEKIYKKLMPYSTAHPNMATLLDRPNVCPKCGEEAGFVAMGWKYSKTGRYRRYQCKACGSYVSERTQSRGLKPDFV